jgi:hypothetical protein
MLRWPITTDTTVDVASGSVSSVVRPRPGRHARLILLGAWTLYAVDART